MSKFKVGLKVRWKPDGFIGTIKKRCPNLDNSWYINKLYSSCNEEYLEIVEEKKEKQTFDPKKSFCIYDFESDEEREEVQKILFSKGLEWNGNNKSSININLDHKAYTNVPYKEYINSGNTIKDNKFIVVSSYNTLPKIEDDEYKAPAKDFIRDYGEIAFTSSHPMAQPRNGEITVIKESNINNNKFNIMEIIKQIPRALKKVLSKELKAQFKAGYIDEKLELTETGIKRINEISQEHFKKELSERAEEEIAEFKKK